MIDASSEIETMDYPLISVIMPCYNAERFVAEAIESVLNQTYPNIELIVIDDGSTDRSLEILRGYNDLIRLHTQQNQGPYPARNYGLTLARGEYVAFLDADDLWSSDCLEKLHVTLAAHSECALAYCGWQNVGTRKHGTHPFVPKNYEQPDKLERLLTGGSPWPIHAALVRKEAIDAIGGFREDLSTSLDYELWLRLASVNRVILVPEVLAFYRFHGAGQISSRPHRQALNGWCIKRRFLLEHPDVIGHLGTDKVRDIVDFALLKRGYHFHWKRDLVSSQLIFRKCLRVGAWRMADLRYLLVALLPLSWYELVVGLIDRPPNSPVKR